MRKPILTSDQLVQHMVDNGIKFTIIDQESAKKHLSDHNNYFKLSSYRKNYLKYTPGPKAGQYERLEFKLYSLRNIFIAFLTTSL